ncbi:MAG: AI-2E family transporter [Lachnospiraceae bacterium]|nr:AI-2E family transporter [Lachnospiraceae bacterium]
MEFSRHKIRQIRHLMLLGTFLVLVLIYSEKVFEGIVFLFGILSPFLVGGVIAFVLNIPMRAFEEKLLARWKGKSAQKLKRPVCMVLSLISVVLVITVVIGTVVPQVASTASEVGKKIPAFMDSIIEELDKLTKKYPELAEQVSKLEKLEMNWESVVNSIFDFLKNGAGDVLNSTVNVASGIISGVVNAVISFIFALYILSQKEVLAGQGRRVLTAYLPEAVSSKTTEVCSLLYRNFSSFITGQCLEAVILGTMFVISMTLFRMPYALMVGVLIAFTALIPIVGAFIGCAVGAFLILIDDPLLALWFIILFLVLQQIEGNLIYPRVVGNSVGLPAIWVLMAVSVGGSLFGVSGMLFFIPLMSSCYALLRESVNRRNAGKRIPVLAGGQVPRPEGENPQRQRPGERKGHAEAKAGTGEGHAEAKAGERKGRNR